MTFEQYIRNPMGGAVMSNKQVYRVFYENKWNNILVRENGTIKYLMYKDKHDFFIHYKIPSEVVPNFYYDVIIRFYPGKGSAMREMEPNLNNYEVQFYSNDPNFVFVFAHAFAKHDLFIKDLLPKASPESIKKKANVKNPKDEVGYVKTLYFAYLDMTNNLLFHKSRWNKAMAYNPSVWEKNVTPADEKVADRQREGYNVSKKDIAAENRKRNLESGKSVPTGGESGFVNSGFARFKSTIEKFADFKPTKFVSNFKRGK